MDRTTERLSALVCDLHSHELTPQTVLQVKRVLVDTLACAMGGYLEEDLPDHARGLRRGDCHRATVIRRQVGWHFRSTLPSDPTSRWGP
jgi:2-methylcitrate dehydratase PrpD